MFFRIVMDTFFSTPLIISWATIFLSFLIPFSHSVNFQLSRFSPDSYTVMLEGDAVYSSGLIEFNKVIYVNRVGRVVYNGKIPLWDSNKLTDFTTHFSFTVGTLNSSSYGHGISFFLAPVGFQIPPNSGGGFLGLFNTTTTDSSKAQIVAVEFDSFFNPDWDDPPYPHVGIDENSLRSKVTGPWNISSHSDETGDAWIIYNSTTKIISVFWSYKGGQNSTISYQVDLKQVLPQWASVGIVAATGSSGNVESHRLVSWEFSSSVDIKDSHGGDSKRTNRLIVGFTMSGCILIVAGGIIAALLVLRRRRNSRPENKSILTSIINDDDLERGSGPKRFSYKELVSATSNFSDEKKLGEGGFGGVYKGHLIDLDVPIAVKKFSRGSKQGKKEYLTEVKIISMLRHKNLVRLIGWCHDQGQFMLVYEFMPNGSLDYHLFGKRNPLSWAFRYKIAIGIASALLYLHEEWEQCVIHRDIKSSNVMLDSGFNVKLGDFGLARLTDHELGPQTTGLAGTLGYLAPEYISTCRASKESDVYSFGIVALEIATGRKSVDPFDDDPHKFLVEWVWDLYGNGKILSGADVKLQEHFDPKQLECLMMVGLWCAHPDWSLRPSIRQASHVLNFEAKLPDLPTKMPVAMYYEPVTPKVDSGEPCITSSSINVGR